MDNQNEQQISTLAYCAMCHDMAYCAQNKVCAYAQQPWPNNERECEAADELIKDRDDWKRIALEHGNEIKERKKRELDLHREIDARDKQLAEKDAEIKRLTDALPTDDEIKAHFNSGYGGDSGSAIYGAKWVKNSITRKSKSDE